MIDAYRRRILSFLGGFLCLSFWQGETAVKRRERRGYKLKPPADYQGTKASIDKARYVTAELMETGVAHQSKTHGLFFLGGRVGVVHVATRHSQVAISPKRLHHLNWDIDLLGLSIFFSWIWSMSSTRLFQQPCTTGSSGSGSSCWTHRWCTMPPVAKGLHSGKML